ncbi:hypothetical protein [Thermolongibacillus altinsuensis]|uniref:hypothetical protein n=1 Tax=Thermolongibacillus altinsuensis TaxID=575256 RepID=UPI001052EBFC|nr:hypothetical protein [Thermolongibacillus altinsuensis]
MNHRYDESSSSFDYKTYTPQHRDVVICFDGSVFLITNGKLFGPTAYVLAGSTSDQTMIFLKYQGMSLEEVVSMIHKNHGIQKVERGFKSIIKNMIKPTIGF